MAPSGRQRRTNAVSLLKVKLHEGLVAEGVWLCASLRPVD